MSDSDRKRLADTRRLIFRNLANGVDVEDVMVAYKLSEKEVLDHFRYVARKIWSYRFERGQPYIRCETPTDANHQRLALFFTLDRCGDNYLTSDHRTSREQTAVIRDNERSVADDMIADLSARQHRS